MLDLETLGTKPGCVIASIGAVTFSREGVTTKFYCRVDIEDSFRKGFLIDPATVKWWMLQSETARQEIAGNTQDDTGIQGALQMFRGYLNSYDGEVCVWGNGASFDNAILSHAYAHLDMEQPWKFWNDRCYRTLKSLHPEIPMPKRVGTHHNALDDAESQALHLITLPSFQLHE